MSTSVTHSKRHLDIDADEINADLNGTINTATTATTQSTSDNSTKVSTTAFVKAQGYITTQSDTQDLSLLGNTVSLVDGGSVDISATTAVAANTSHAASAHAPSNAQANVAETNDLTSAVTWANVPIANIPTGTTSATVALGNHNHSGVYATAAQGSTADSALQSFDITTQTDSKYVRSNAADTFTGILTGTATGENLKVGGIRGTAKGSQTGEYLHLYERVHIGGPSGWGASTHGAPGYGLSTWGSANFGQNGSGVIQLDDTTIVNASRQLVNVTNTNWDTAYGWGDHGSAGYGTSNLAIGTTSTTALAGNTSIPSISGLASTSYVDAKTWNWNDITAGTVPSTILNSNVTLSTLGAAASSHTHTYSSITGKPTTFAPTIGTTSTTALAGNTSIPSISGLATTSYVNGLASNYATAAQGTLAEDALQSLSGAVLTTGDQTIAGEKTFSGDLTISQTDATAPGVMLNLHNVSNGVGTTIRCTDVSAGTSQFGDITYRHQDSKAYGSAAMFELGSTELTTTILANGKLMYNEGIYSKPASGTGAGTRKDANWDTAYTHSQAAHAPEEATVNSSDATLLDRGNHTGTQTYSTISNPPTIPSGNAILDWTTDRGTTNIHTGNYTNTTYNKASPTYLGLVMVGSGLNISAAGALSVTQAEEADEENGGAMSAEDKTKLNAIEETADVTDATNVAAAGASMKSATETISGAKTFSSTIVGSINGNSATTSERTITSGEISAISTNTLKVGITTGTQTIAGAKTFSTQIIGQTINLGSSSGYINRTAAQFATDGTDKVYIGSNNYGWNDARDYATNLVDVDAPVLDQNDQHCGIICPVNVSQVSIMSQVRMNAANGTMQVKVYKMARATAVNTANLALTLIASATVSTVNGRMTTLDATGSTAVSAGDLIIVGFGKTDSGAGQKPRFNFTLTGTTS